MQSATIICGHDDQVMESMACLASHLWALKGNPPSRCASCAIGAEVRANATEDELSEARAQGATVRPNRGVLVGDRPAKHHATRECGMNTKVAETAVDPEFRLRLATALSRLMDTAEHGLIPFRAVLAALADWQELSPLLFGRVTTALGLEKTKSTAFGGSQTCFVCNEVLMRFVGLAPQASTPEHVTGVEGDDGPHAPEQAAQASTPEQAPQADQAAPAPVVVPAPQSPIEDGWEVYTARSRRPVAVIITEGKSDEMRFTSRAREQFGLSKVDAVRLMFNAQARAIRIRLVRNGEDRNGSLALRCSGRSTPTVAVGGFFSRFGLSAPVGEYPLHQVAPDVLEVRLGEVS